MYELDPIEVRILGCLLEKQRTTPDQYPLTLNALRLACNQSTNRDPVTEYGEGEIQDALQRLHRRELTRVASGHGSRASKYRHLLAEQLDLDSAQTATLCVLLLRGAQTPGELKQRPIGCTRSPISPPCTTRSIAWSSVATSGGSPIARAKRRIAISSCSARRGTERPRRSPPSQRRLPPAGFLPPPRRMRTVPRRTASIEWSGSWASCATRFGSYARHSANKYDSS